MKKSILVLVLHFFIFNSSYAQHKGNYNDEDFKISRQNIALSGNANIYNPAVQQQINKILNPSSNVINDVKALQNVKAVTYTAAFTLSQIRTTAAETKSPVSYNQLTLQTTPYVYIE